MAKKSVAPVRTRRRKQGQLGIGEIRPPPHEWPHVLVAEPTGEPGRMRMKVGNYAQTVHEFRGVIPRGVQVYVMNRSTDRALMNVAAPWDALADQHGVWRPVWPIVLPPGTVVDFEFTRVDSKLPVDGVSLIADGCAVVPMTATEV